MSDVLLVGSPQDKALQTVYQRCESMGHATQCWDPSQESYPELDGISETFVLWFYQANVDAKAGLARLTGRLAHGSLILACQWTVTPTALAACYQQPDHLMGFSPMGLYRELETIELAPGLQTSPVLLEKAAAFLETLGLRSIKTQETPAGVFPRILAMLVNEAVSALMEGVATPEDIDTAMKLGTNYPEGPLAWADAVGLDVIYGTLNHLYEEYREDRYRPMLLLKQKILAGQLGLKTGQGFYQHTRQVVALEVGL